MLFVNVIKDSFTDLMKKSYEDALSYNSDHTGFVYTSEQEQQDMVFFPVLENDEKIDEVAHNMIDDIWKKRLIYNMMPFPFAVALSLLAIYLILPLGWHFSAAAGIFSFLIVLYLSKLSFTIIGTVISYQMFLNDKFKVLIVYQNLGQYSSYVDCQRARTFSAMQFSPLNNNSEILANSHFIEVRRYQQDNITKPARREDSPIQAL